MCGKKPCALCAKKNTNIGSAMKRKRKTTKKRAVRGVGATSPRQVGGFNLERMLSFGGGAIVAEYGVNTAVNALTKDGKMKGLKSGYAVGGAKILLGVAGIMYSKNPMVRDASAGAIAAGGLDIGRTLMDIPKVVAGVGVGDIYPSDYNIGASFSEEDAAMLEAYENGLY